MMNKYLAIITTYSMLYIIPAGLILYYGKGWFAIGYGATMLVLGFLVIAKRFIEARHLIDYRKDFSLKNYRDAKQMDREESTGADK